MSFDNLIKSIRFSKWSSNKVVFFRYILILDMIMSWSSITAEKNRDYAWELLNWLCCLPVPRSLGNKQLTNIRQISIYLHIYLCFITKKCIQLIYYSLLMSDLIPPSSCWASTISIYTCLHIHLDEGALLYYDRIGFLSDEIELAIHLTGH